MATGNHQWNYQPNRFSIMPSPPLVKRTKSRHAPLQAPTDYSKTAASTSFWSKKFLGKKLSFWAFYVVPPVTILMTIILLLPVMAAIAQSTLHSAHFDVQSSNITKANDSSFDLALRAKVTKTGIFPAKLQFGEPLSVYWNDPTSNQELRLGHFDMGQLSASGGSATVNQLSTFHIDDQEAFTTFTKYLVSEPSFTWHVNCSSVHVKAFNFLPVYRPLTLQKDITIKGLSNLPNITLIDVKLPGDDPAGGIQVSATALIVNPSPFGMEVGTLVLGLYYKDLFLGPVQANGVNLVGGDNLLILSGRILPYTDNGTALAQLGILFTNYINNIPTIISARGINATQTDGQVVQWLSKGISSLDSSISFVPPKPIDSIKDIMIDYINLDFHKDRPFSPDLSSKGLKGTLSLPFGFSLDITKLATDLTMMYKGAAVGSVKGGYTDATTNITMQTSEETFGTIALTLPTTPMMLPNSSATAKQELIQFEKALVQSSGAVKFVAQGSAKAVANTPVGQIVLDGIHFNVTTGLVGLNGLKTFPTVIDSVDVVGGTQDGISLAVALSLVNPSNLNLSTGDVNFHLGVDGSILGTTTVQNMMLKPGKNHYHATAQFDPNRAPKVGSKMLGDFISGRDTRVEILGFPGSSSIPSLAPSLEGIKLSSTLPSLHQLLVKQTSLVIPKNIAQTGIAFASVKIANPFTSPIEILQLDAAADFEQYTLGTIKQDLVAQKNTIHAPGKQTSFSQKIPISLNLEPKHLIQFLEAAAAKYHISLGPLPPFFKEVLDLPDTKTSIKAYPDEVAPPCHSGRAFDTTGAVMKLLEPLTASIPIQSKLKLGEYSTSLSFVQEPVPVKMDRTALYLIGPAAAPLIQLIVNNSILKIALADATNLVDIGFDVTMSGSLATKTPADAYIEFPDGLTVNFQGNDIASLTLTPLCASPPDGIPDLKSKGRLTILDEKKFTDFTVHLLKDAKFQWHLHTKTAVVRTLGIRFSNVTLEKTIELDAMDGLPGLTIEDFTAPGDGPGEINILATAPIKSLASLGVQVDTITFDLVFQGNKLGSIHSNQLFIAAKTTTVTSFSGTLIDQAGNEKGLASVGILFSQYMQGTSTTMMIRGVEARTRANDMKPVKWLSDALQQFTTNVTLPGKVHQILYSISLSDLTVVVKESKDPYTIVASNKQTLSTFSNPFAFRLQPLQIHPKIIIAYDGVQTASLSLPQLAVEAGISHGPKDVQSLSFGFQNQDLVAIHKDAFSHFFAVLANSVSTAFTVSGSTSVVARTQIGNVIITGVHFTLPTSMKGMNGLNGLAPVSNVTVDDPTPQYLGIHLIAELDNPSNMTIFTDSVTLPVYQATSMIFMGLAIIPTLNLFPGRNLIPTLFQLHLSGNDTNVLAILSDFVQPKDFLTEGLANHIPLQIQGKMNTDPPVTPYPALEESLAEMKLKGDLVGLGARIVLNVRVYIPVSLVTQAMGGIMNSTAANEPLYAFGYIDAVNNLQSALRFVQLDTSVANTKDPKSGEYSRFTHTFTDQDPFELPAALPNGQPSVNFTTSPMIPNILLTKGLLKSLPLIPNNVNTDNHVQAYIVGPHGQFFLPGLHYMENDVNTTYFITTRSSGDEGGFQIKKPMDSLKDLLGLLDPSSLASVMGSFTDLNPNDKDSILNKFGSGVAELFGGGAKATSQNATTNSTLPSSQPLSILPSSSSSSPLALPAMHRRRRKVQF